MIAVARTTQVELISVMVSRERRKQPSWGGRRALVRQAPTFLIRVSACGGPSRGAEPVLFGRSSWPCVHGTHACACGGPCWVDKCASWLMAPVQR